MSYALELYALDWNRLTSLLGMADRELFERIAARAPELWPAGSEEAAGRQLVFRRTLEAFLLGPRGRELAGRGPLAGEVEEVSEIAAIAFSNILATTGQFVGALDHSSTAGDLFRTDFILRLPLLLGASLDAALLLERPLFGIVHRAYPSWGGLHRDEIAGLTAGRDVETLPLPGDTDVDRWLFDLYEALAECAARETDLVTVYW